MSKTYLLLDCNYLCHRAKHSTGVLSYGGKPTEVIYGFLKSLIGFSEKFHTTNFIFCWDSKTSARQKIYPQYKAQRAKRHKEMTEEEKKFEKGFREQMKMLRKVYLKQIGFRNIFCQKGREADDVIGSHCTYHFHTGQKKKAVIITSDKDMYQLLGKNVSLFNPHTRKMITEKKFTKEYKIEPHEWTLVKALAGCLTDNIKGVKGVGEKTAIKHLRDLLNPDSKISQEITAPYNLELYMSNFELVELPMRRTKLFKLKEDELSSKGWKEVMKLLGMKSLKDKMPFRIRKRK